MPGHGNRLVRDTLHKAAVTDDGIGMVINQIVTEPGIQHSFRKGHTDGVGNPLPERPRRGLDPGGMAEFRMPCCLRTDLAEVAQLIHCHVLIAGQMQKRIDQHRAVTGRQNKAITVRPCRVSGIEFQKLAV